MSETAQTALPGQELQTGHEWLLTLEYGGIQYFVIVETLTAREAAERFHDEFTLYELGIYDGDYDDHHVAVFARSRADAEAIALARDRSYLKVYDVATLGNDATVVHERKLEDVDGWQARRAKRDRQVINDG